MAKAQSELDHAQLEWIVEGEALALHRRFGYASYREYLGRLFGWSPHTAEERLRTAKNLVELPLLREAPSAMAALKEAKRLATKEVGHSLSDDELVELLCRRFTGGPNDEGRSPYQVVIHRCPECQVVTQQAGPEEIVLDDAAAARAHYNAQIVDLRHTDAVRSHVGGDRARDRSHVGGGAAEDRSHVGAEPTRSRALQTIPPAVRRKVLARHRGKCAAPGCECSVYLELHHLDLVSEGGTHDPERLLPLCFSHHRAFHEGRLLIGGRASSGFSFRHADGAPYGGCPSPRAQDAFSAVHRALVKMGFRDREARAVLERCRETTSDETVEGLLRTALSRMEVPGVCEAEVMYLPVRGTG